MARATTSTLRHNCDKPVCGYLYNDPRVRRIFSGGSSNNDLFAVMAVLAVAASVDHYFRDEFYYLSCSHGMAWTFEMRIPARTRQSRGSDGAGVRSLSVL